MKTKIITEIEQSMLKHLDNAQLKELHKVLEHIKSITVYRESVVFSLDCGFGLLDGVVREITAKRIDFKTPSQRM